MPLSFLTSVLPFDVVTRMSLPLNLALVASPLPIDLIKVPLSLRNSTFPLIVVTKISEPSLLMSAFTASPLPIVLIKVPLSLRSSTFPLLIFRMFIFFTLIIFISSQVGNFHPAFFKLTHNVPAKIRRIGLVG